MHILGIRKFSPANIWVFCDDVFCDDVWGREFEPWIDSNNFKCMDSNNGEVIWKFYFYSSPKENTYNNLQPTNVYDHLFRELPFKMRNTARQMHCKPMRKPAIHWAKYNAFSLYLLYYNATVLLEGSKAVTLRYTGRTSS